MPGPHHAPKGGYVKPKNMKKTMGRLVGYLTKSKLPLLFVLLCLLASVGTNLGGSYLVRPIINNFIWSGCTDFAGLGRAILHKPARHGELSAQVRSEAARDMNQIGG